MEHKFTGLQVAALKKPLWRLSLMRLKLALDQWNQNLVTRKQLSELDDKQLMDIGIDRITANRESKKPFWVD